MSEDAVREPKIKVWGGVLFLFISMTIITMIAKQSGSNDHLDGGGIGLATILSIVVYVILAKRYHLNDSKKAILLFVLLILQFFGSAYLAGYYYRTSPSGAEVGKFSSRLALLKPQEKFKELSDMRDNILVLAKSIESNPQNIEQAKKYIDVIDQLIVQNNNFYKSKQYWNEQMLALISSVSPDPNIRKEIEKVLSLDIGMNINVLAASMKQHDKWYEALKANLSARKEYYESFIKHESAQTQDYLLRKWSTLEDAYLKEESKLAQIKFGVKTQRNGAAQK